MRCPLPCSLRNSVNPRTGPRSPGVRVACLCVCGRGGPRGAAHGVPCASSRREKGTRGNIQAGPAGQGQGVPIVDATNTRPPRPPRSPCLCCFCPAPTPNPNTPNASTGRKCCVEPHMAANDCRKLRFFPGTCACRRAGRAQQHPWNSPATRLPHRLCSLAVPPSRGAAHAQRYGPPHPHQTTPGRAPIAETPSSGASRRVYIENGDQRCRHEGIDNTSSHCVQVSWALPANGSHAGLRRGCLARHTSRATCGVEGDQPAPA